MRISDGSSDVCSSDLGVLAALDAEESDWANGELATIHNKSPLSCKVSLRLLADGAARANFTDEMRAEYALAGRVVRTHDFREALGSASCRERVRQFV